MAQKSLFLNQNRISSQLEHYLSLSDNHVIPFILSIITTTLTLFPLLPSQACRRRKEIEIKEGDACCPEMRCMICLDSVFCDDGNQVSTLVGCNHCFHKYCFEKWLEYNPTCPICRVPVRRASRKGWFHCLWRFLLACVLRWMDRHFDSDLAFAFCNDS